MTIRLRTILRYALGVLLGIIALNAFAGGWYALSGAKGVPTEWLEGSPFQDYSIPGLVLFVVIGGVFLMAAIAVFVKAPIARPATFMAVLIVFVWLATQLAIIGYVSWMQPTTAIIAAVIFILAIPLSGSRQNRI